MTALQSLNSEINWQLGGFDARLQIRSLAAHLNLQDPQKGLGSLTWNSVSLPGSLLGIDFTRTSDERENSVGEGIESFVRGTDLVARYPETQSQPFSLEVYWRVGVSGAALIQIDTIVSLQTSLLECYPSAQTISSLHAQEAWIVPVSSSNESHHISPGQKLSSDEFAGVLLRGVNEPWSYLEMTHPEDLGTWKIEWIEPDKWTLQRSLGGEFQEKGVIRRLRVRGILLPRAGDLEIAPQLLHEFAYSPPPLTA